MSIALLAGLLAILAAYAVYSINPELTTSIVNIGTTAWYVIAAVFWVFTALAFLLSGSSRLVVIGMLVLFIIAILVLAREPFEDVRV